MTHFRRVQVDVYIGGWLVCWRSGWISRYDPGHWDVAPTAADAGRLSPWQQPRCTHRGDAHMQTRPACTWKPVHAVARIRCFVHIAYTAHTTTPPPRYHRPRATTPYDLRLRLMRKNLAQPFQRNLFPFLFLFLFPSLPSFLLLPLSLFPPLSSSPCANYRGNPFN